MQQPCAAVFDPVCEGRVLHTPELWQFSARTSRRSTAVDGWNDMGLGDFELGYLRDKEKREVDFLIARDGKPWFLVEVKQRDEKGGRALEYFQEQLDAPDAPGRGGERCASLESTSRRRLMSSRWWGKEPTINARVDGSVCPTAWAARQVARALSRRGSAGN